MSSGKNLQIHTDVALSCDLFHGFKVCSPIFPVSKSNFFLQNGQTKTVTFNNLTLLSIIS